MIAAVLGATLDNDPTSPIILAGSTINPYGLLRDVSGRIINRRRPRPSDRYTGFQSLLICAQEKETARRGRQRRRLRLIF